MSEIVFYKTITVLAYEKGRIKKVRAVSAPEVHFCGRFGHVQA
jgi:hypothetical protein